MTDELRIAYLEHVEVTPDAIGEQATIAYLATSIKGTARRLEKALTGRAADEKRKAKSGTPKSGEAQAISRAEQPHWAMALSSVNDISCLADEVLANQAAEQQLLAPLADRLATPMATLLSSTYAYRRANPNTEVTPPIDALSASSRDLSLFVHASPGSTIRGLISLSIIGVKLQQFLNDARAAFEGESVYVPFPDRVETRLSFLQEQATRLANRSDLAALCASPEDVRAEIDRLCRVLQDSLAAVEEIECAIDELERETGLTASCNRLKRELDEAAHWVAGGLFLACRMDVQDESEPARLRRYWNDAREAAEALATELKSWTHGHVGTPSELFQGGPAHLIDMTNQGLREAEVFLESGCLCDVPEQHVDLAERVYAEVSNLYGRSHALPADFDHGVFRNFWVPLAGIRLMLCACPDDDECDTTEGKVARLVHLFDEVRSQVEGMPCDSDHHPGQWSGRRGRHGFGVGGCRHRAPAGIGIGREETPAYGQAASPAAMGWSPFAGASWGPLESPASAGPGQSRFGPNLASRWYWTTIQDSIQEMLPKVSDQSKLMLEKAAQESSQVLYVLTSQALPPLTTERAQSSSLQVVSLIRGAVGYDKGTVELWNDVRRKLKALEAPAQV